MLALQRAMLREIHRYIRMSFTIVFLLMCLMALKPEDLGEPWSEIAHLMNARNYAGAIEKLRRHAESSSEVEHLAEIYYRIGFIHHEYTHDYDQALDAYQRVVSLGKKAESPSALEPYLPLSQMSIAGIYRRVGRYDDAIEIYRKVAADYAGLGYATYAIRNIKGIQDALAEIQLQKRIIDKYSNTEFAAEAQFEIAEVCLSVQNLDNPERAIQEYARLVEQYPNSRRAAEAQLKIGDIYRTVLNKPNEAISAYEKLVQSQFSVSKLGAEALFRIGRIYCNDLHEYGKALDTFQLFLRDYPTYWKFPAAVYWQGVCYEQLRDYDNAIRAFEMFVRIYPDDEPGWLADIGKLGEMEVKAESESRIDELKKLAPEAQWREAERLRSLEKYREALVIYRELMTRYPDSEYSKKARIQADRVENLAEIQVCQDIIKGKGIEAPAAQYRIAEIYEIEMQDYPRAVKEYERVAANYPNAYQAADALYRMGFIYSGLNSSDVHSAEEDRKTRRGIKPDYHKAIEKYRQLIGEYPNTYTAARAYCQMGEIYRNHLSDHKQALEAYRRVVNDYPKRNLYVGEGYKDSLADEAQFKIGRIYYESLQNHDMALKTFTKFLNDYPDSCRKAAAYSFVAAIQEKRKDYKAAVISLEQISDIIFDSEVQSSFFIRDALYEADSLESGLRGFDLQRDIIKQLRRKISQLQGQG